MHVGVVHHISDPDGFEAAEFGAMEHGLPEGFSRPIRSATPDRTTGISIWHGRSVEAVTAFVEQVVGAYSTNEYFELNVVVDHDAVGLPAARHDPT